MAVLLLILVVGAGVGFWWWRRQQGGRSTSDAGMAVTSVGSATSASSATERRPGRMINPGENPCQGCQKIQSAWYPEGGTPRLPLDACEHPDACRCTWMRVLDRRVTHRRVGQDRRGELRFEDKSDRRTGDDRRDRKANVWKNSG